MKIKNSQLQPLLVTLSDLSFPNDITIESISGIITLTSKLSSIYKDFQSTTKALMDSYSILPSTETGGYSWTDNSDADEITSKYNDLLNIENDIDVKLSETNLFAKIGKGLHIQQVVLLKQVLES